MPERPGIGGIILGFGLGFGGCVFPSGWQLGAILLAVSCGSGNDVTSPTSSSDPDQAAIEACQEAANASFRLVETVSDQVQNRVEGSQETLREVRRAIRQADGPIRRCNQFSSTENSQVQACGRAAKSGGKAAEAILNALDAPTQNLVDAFVMEAEFYLDQQIEALGECGN